MSNTNAPFGFQPVYALDGAPTNYGLARGFMLATQSSALGEGDPLQAGSSGSQGYLIPTTLSSPTSTGQTQAGIAKSFNYLSIANKRRIWTNYWPGSDCVANTLVSVTYYTHPFLVYKVQCTLGPVTQANVGEFCNITLGTPNANNGLSTASLDDSTIAASQGSLPCKIVEIPGVTSSGNQILGSDPASAYNTVYVQLVNLISGLR